MIIGILTMRKMVKELFPNYENTDSPFFIYHSDKQNTFRQTSYWNLSDQTDDFAERWLGGKTKSIE